MARDFAGGSADFLENTSFTAITAFPYTLAVRFNPDNATQSQGGMFGMFNTGHALLRALLYWNLSADSKVHANVNHGSGALDLAASATASPGAWTSGVMVRASATSMTLYSGTNVSSTSTSNIYPPSGYDKVTLGRWGYSTPAAPYDGKLAEAAIWNVALSAADAAALADGYSPESVRPDGLVFYSRLMGRSSPEPEYRGSVNLTLTGTVAQFSHPRVLYPRRRTIILPAAAAGGAIDITPPVGSLTLTGNAPLVTFQLRMTPAAGALTLTGAAPTAVVTAPASAALDALTFMTEEILTGAQVRITLTGAKWLAAGAPFEAIRQDIINLISGDLSEPKSFNAVRSVIDPETAVFRDSDTVARIAFFALADPGVYDINSDETLSCADVASAMTQENAGDIAVSGSEIIHVVTVAVSPAAGSLSITGAAPSVTISGDLNIAPAAGALAITGASPSITMRLAFLPAAGALTITGAAPSAVVTSGYFISPASGSLTLTGASPLITLRLALFPAAGALTITGAAPTVSTGAFVLMPTAVEFDGTNDYLTRGADLTGAVDAKVGLFSVWVNPATVVGDQELLTNSTGRFTASLDDDGIFVIQCWDATPLRAFHVRTPTNSIVAGKWQHILASWDAATTTINVYIDDVAQSLTHVVTAADRTIDYTAPNWGVGAAPTGLRKYTGCMSNLYFAIEALDITSSANRLKVRTASGTPADIGADGSTVTGTAPIVYLRGDQTDFHVNYGSGGNFAVTGDLDDCATTPFDFLETPAAGALTITGASPSVTFRLGFSPDAGSLVITGYAPDVINTGAVVTPTAPDGGGRGAKAFGRSGGRRRRVVIDGQVYTVTSEEELRALLEAHRAALKARLEAAQEQADIAEPSRLATIKREIGRTRARIRKVEEDLETRRLMDDDEEIVLWASLH